jgi:hypothetical protein
MFTILGLWFPLHAILEGLYGNYVLVRTAVLLLQVVLGGHVLMNALRAILGIRVGPGKVVEALNLGQSLETTCLLRINDDDVRDGDIHVDQDPLAGNSIVQASRRTMAQKEFVRADTGERRPQVVTIQLEGS